MKIPSLLRRGGLLFAVRYFTKPSNPTIGTILAPSKKLKLMNYETNKQYHKHLCNLLGLLSSGTSFNKAILKIPTWVSIELSQSLFDHFEVLENEGHIDENTTKEELEAWNEAFVEREIDVLEEYFL